MRKIGLIVVLLLSVLTPANAADVIVGATPAYAPTTSIAANGVNFASNTSLFANTSASLQFAGPFSVSFGIKFSSVINNTYFLNNFVGSLGFVIRYNTSFSNSENMQFALVGGAGGTCYLSETCVRTVLVNDNNWHNICSTWNGSNQITTYVDGVMRDQTRGATPFTSSTHFWTIGLGNQAVSMRDLRVYNASIGATGCGNLGKLALAGKTPSGGVLQNNLVVYLPMSNCTSSGCPDSSGKSNDFIFDSTPPTVAITSPANGATGLSGNVPVNATCVDPISCTSVSVTVDGINIGIATVAPYVATWISAGYADGSHNIIATGTNVAGVVGTSTTITVSSNNGIGNKTFYVSNAGSDSNNCTATGTPCQTIGGVQAKINASPLIGGDSVLFHAGDSYTLSDMTAASVLTICGPNSSSWAECNLSPVSFTASVSGTTMMVTAVSSGTLQVGDSIVGTGTVNVIITSLGSGSGGVGTYNINQNLSLASTNLLTAALPNYVPGAGATTIGTYGGSGNCHVLSAVTTDCVTFVFTSSSGAVPFYGDIITAVNTPNLVIQNFRFDGSGTAALSCNYHVSGCGGAVGIKTAGNYVNRSSPGIIVQNIETTDFILPITFMNTTTGDYPTSGTLCGATLQDSYVHGTSISTMISVGVDIYGLSCATPTAGTISNYVNDIGGQLTVTDGSDLQYVNGANGVIDNYNVTLNAGWNSTTCGPYGNWWYETGVLGPSIVLGNESGIMFASAAKGCDSGAFDLDNGTSNFTLNFNYAHETIGPSLNLLIASVSAYTAGFNTVAYNVFENGDAGCNNYNCNMWGGGALVGYYTVYNNNSWNGYAGSIIPPFTQTTQGAAFGYGACPPLASVAANNISVSAGAGEAMYGGYPAFVTTCTSLVWRANNWWRTNGGNPFWRSIASTLDSVSPVAAWNAAVSATDTQLNPNFAGSGGAGVQCWATLSGIPVQPGSIPCPTNYELNNSGNALIGVGIDLTASPYNLAIPANDYYANAIPNGTGTGYNVGADGGHH